MNGSADNGVPAFLECRGLSKSYGAVRALRGVDLSVRKGSVHGIVGHNGAGKSTLVKIISGEVRPDKGSVQVGGDEITNSGRRAAIDHGVWMVPQELSVMPEMTVADNVSVGNESRRGIFVKRREMRRRAAETLEALGLHELPPEMRVEELSPSRKRMVMIAMAVSRDCRVLILDEPTASLGTDEAEPLLQLITRLADQGITILYISHRLDEVERLCDEVTVIKDGAAVRRLARGHFVAKDLIREMVDELPSRSTELARREPGEVTVRFSGVTGKSLHGVDFTARAGAITGFTGLVGSGADEILEIISGSTPHVSGKVEILGEEVRFRSEADALRARIGFVPGTRAEAALVDLTIRENVLASSFEKVASFGTLFGRRERRAAEKAVDSFGLAKRVEQPLAALSGGNQQKVLFGRLLEADVEILVINDPSAGVDVHARADLHRLLGEVAASGRTVIVRCSEPEELIELADKVYALAGGRIAASFEGHDLSAETLIAASANSGRSAVV